MHSLKKQLNHKLSTLFEIYYFDENQWLVLKQFNLQLHELSKMDQL